MPSMSQPPHQPDADLVASLHQGPVDIAALNWPADCGAECLFVGRTRAETHPKLGPLKQLQYEVYPEMAQRLLAEMVREAAQRFGCRAVRLVHSVGSVGLGQASIVIQVATAHRSESFDACRYLIERVKHELPIWKREVWQLGETFVEGCCAHHPSDRLSQPPADAPAFEDPHE